MTIALIILTAALLATLHTAHRLLRQRDAERRRGDLALAELDAQIEETGRAREKVGQIAAEKFALERRVYEVERRELPQLDEIRARKADSPTQILVTGGWV